MTSKLDPRLDRILRVDQAGEYGAVRIYAGQMAVMGTRGPHADKVAHMATQEAEHREAFDALLAPDRFKDYAPNGLQVEGRAEVQRLVSGVTASKAARPSAVVTSAATTDTFISAARSMSAAFIRTTSRVPSMPRSRSL